MKKDFSYLESMMMTFEIVIESTIDSFKFIGYDESIVVAALSKA